MTRCVYRCYRRAKTWLLIHRPPVLTYLFFALLVRIERFVAARKERVLDPHQRRLERELYFLKYSRQRPPFVLRSEASVAHDSADHCWPHGAIFDNSANPRFNCKLYAMLDHPPDLTLLDLGCSGGAFVRSILDDGYTAVGLEGSDICKRLQRAEWSAIPLHLFTCDITRPFSVHGADGQKVLFDVVTAWEVLEHIPRQAIPQLVRNVRENLKPEGFFFASVATFPDANPNCGAVYHVTLEDRAWWTRQFCEAGFVPVEDHDFKAQDWVRGNGQGLTDWDPSDGDGFHLVLQRRP